MATAAAALAAGPADMVLVDLGLPDMDGLDVCRELRARGDVPIIVISARADEVDKVVGLEIGADDYVSKPFGVREVIARMRAVLRRVRPAEPDAQAEPPPAGSRSTGGRGGCSSTAPRSPWHPRNTTCWRSSPRHPGAAFTREQIMEAVWDENWFGPTRTLDVHVGALRRKLGDAATIETVRGVGFRLVLP